MKTTKGSKTSNSVIMKTPVSEAESDRRLRPVIDALYARKTKSALKLVQQALQRRPGWPAARALRACALIQMNKIQEAESEVTQIREDLNSGRVPLDEDAARKIHLYYQESGKEACAGEVYEQVWKANMVNFRLAELSFCLYIRGNSFASAQKLATKLHRMASSSTQKYGLWATSALWLSVVYNLRETDDTISSPDNRILKLACAIMNKALQSPVAPSAETVRFATRVYKDAGDYDKACSLVSQKRLVMDEAEALHIRASSQPLIDHRKEDYCSLLRNHDKDDWGHWLKYFECIKNYENWREEATLFIDEFVEIELEQPNPKRAPFLAQLELMHRSSNHEALGEAMPRYFNMFGAKTVCAHDLRPYLELMSESSHRQTALNDIFSSARQKGFPYHLTASWLRLWFGCLSELPSLLADRYQNALVEDLEPTERQDGDDYLILTIHALLPASCDNPDNRYSNTFAILQSIVVLEAGLTQSPFNFQFKLLLIRLYIEIGAMDRVIEIWESLQVKHIQMSTLAHIVLKPLFETGHHNALKPILDGIETLWREFDLEIPECITKAFQAGSINAAVEFVLFKQRLEKSVILIEAKVTEALVSIASSGGEDVGLERARNSLTIVPRYAPESINSKTVIDNDDNRCFRFWDSHEFSPEVRLAQKPESSDEQGKLCDKKRKLSTTSQLKSLVELLQLISNEGGLSEQNTSTTSDCCFGNGTTEDIQPLSMLLGRICVCIKAAKKFLVKYTKGAVSNGDHLILKEIDSAELVSLARSLAKDIAREVEDAIAPASDSVTLKATMSPQQLRKSCKLSFEILLISSVAVASLSADVMKGKRRRKKGGVKTGNVPPASVTQCFDNVREAILILKNEILSACSTMQEWITSSLDRNADWLDSICESEHLLNESLPFLSESIHTVDLSDGSRQQQGKIDRVTLCRNTLDRIRSSHSTSCSRLLETLASVARRLNLVDL